MASDLPDRHRPDRMIGSLLAGVVHLTVWVALATMTLSLLLLKGLWQIASSRRQ